MFHLSSVVTAVVLCTHDRVCRQPPRLIFGGLVTVHTALKKVKTLKVFKFLFALILATSNPLYSSLWICTSMLVAHFPRGAFLESPGGSHVVSRPPDSALLASFSPPEPNEGPAPHQPANGGTLGGGQLDGDHPACFASSRVVPTGLLSSL